MTGFTTCEHTLSITLGEKGGGGTSGGLVGVGVESKSTKFWPAPNRLIPEEAWSKLVGMVPRI